MLRTAQQRSALITVSPAPVWSDDGEIAVLCCAELAAPAAGTYEHAARVARAWLDAYRTRPGAWPDLVGVEAAGVIVDLRRAEVHAAVDRMGLQTLFWSRDGDMLRIATRAADAVPKTRAGSGLDPTALYCYVYFHFVPSPLSVFRGVRKLPRAHALHARGGTVEVARYHLETFREHADADLETLSQELLARLRASVARSTDGEAAAGAFLSGGLDSSTVAGLMAERLRPEIGHAFSIGFDAEGYDEMEYARIAVRHFGLRGHEHYLTPGDVLTAAPQLLRASDEPFGNSSFAAVYQCALLARDAGISRMLAGDGGDELFAGNSRYAKQLLFERYLRLPVALRRGLIEPLLGPLGRALPASVLGKAARYVEQANIALPDRLQTYNYLHRHAPEEVFTSSFLESADASKPVDLWRREYAAPDRGDPVNRMLFLDWSYTLHDNDLVKVNTACRVAGMPVAYPMLDHGLVDLSCRLPGSLKMRGDELRWFYKRATQGLLPPAITAKTKHGFGLPFGVWTRTDQGLRRLSEQALESLAERGIFRREFLGDTLRLHREGHAAYYGELVWLLMALEIWLAANAPVAERGEAERQPLAPGIAVASSTRVPSGGGSHSGSE
jgi:asparagine synthase (glutamine-hydrolysing)